MKSVRNWTAVWLLGGAIVALFSSAQSFAKTERRESRHDNQPLPLKGFYCSSTAFRAYSVPPAKSDMVSPIAGSYRVIEESRHNQDHESKGSLALFKPSAAGEKTLLGQLEFNEGYAVSVRGLLEPNGSVNFVIQLVTRKGEKVTRILGEHRETYQLGQKVGESAPLSVDVPNLDVSNVYLRQGTSPLDDKDYAELASFIRKGQLPNGSITGAAVECTSAY